MRKRDLVARIEALERRVAQLEAQLRDQRTWPYVEPWPVIPTTVPKPSIQIEWTCLNTGYDHLQTTTMMKRAFDYTYEGMLLEDRNAYAG